MPRECLALNQKGINPIKAIQMMAIRLLAATH